MQWIFRLFCVLITVALNIDRVENRMTVKLRDINCTTLDKDFCAFPMCKIKAIQRGVSEVTVRVALHHKPVNNVTLRAFLERRGYENQKPILEFQIDACAFLRNKRRNPIANVIYNVIGLPTYSNMNHSCPFDHDLAVERYRFDDTFSNLMMLKVGDYALHTIWHAYNVARAHVTIKLIYVEE